MALPSSLIFLFWLFSLFIVASKAASPSPNAYLFAVRKDQSNGQFYTQFEFGTFKTSSPYVSAVINLGGDLLWFNCDATGYNATTTYRPVGCGTNKCKVAKGIGCLSCNSGPARPGCHNNTCSVFPYNPYVNALVTGGLGEDALFASPTDGFGVWDRQDSKIPKLPLSCVDSDFLRGLSNDTNGMLGLSRARTALPTQFSKVLNVSRKFGLCLPSATEGGLGALILGGGPYRVPPYKKDAATLFKTTKLIVNPVSTATIYSEGERSDEYFINVTSIKIDGTPVSGFKSSLLAIDKKSGVGGTKISTVDRYTVLQSSIYKAAVSAFVKKASLRKMKRVGSVKPFDACFSTKSVGSAKTGAAVPNIDLVMERDSVFWRIYGANSMVKVKKNVMCLGVVDGGLEPRTSIVIGGLQMEDNLLEFDLTNNKLGFSSSLLLKNTTCTHSRLY